MKQTAVEWLIEKTFSDFGKSVKSQEIKMAMQMEKQQIIDAWIATDNELQRMLAEQYYTSTYGSNGRDETKTN